MLFIVEFDGENPNSEAVNRFLMLEDIHINAVMHSETIGTIGNRNDPKREDCQEIRWHQANKDGIENCGRDLNFPIVGIGASAGGLEALELFLANVPAESGTAIVENKNWRQN